MRLNIPYHCLLNYKNKINIEIPTYIIHTTQKYTTYGVGTAMTDRIWTDVSLNVTSLGRYQWWSSVIKNIILKGRSLFVDNTLLCKKWIRWKKVRCPLNKFKCQKIQLIFATRRFTETKWPLVHPILRLPADKDGRQLLFVWRRFIARLAFAFRARRHQTRQVTCDRRACAVQREPTHFLRDVIEDVELCFLLAAAVDDAAAEGHHAVALAHLRGTGVGRHEEG